MKGGALQNMPQYEGFQGGCNSSLYMKIHMRGAED